MKKRSFRDLAATVAMLLGAQLFQPVGVTAVALVATGCNDCAPDRPCCGSGEPCTCEGGVAECTLECGLSCDLDCSTGNLCTQECGDDCEIDCSDMPDCEGSCGANCDYHCSSITNCEVTVGEGSNVLCENASSCDITCTGNCNVEARSVGGTMVTCARSGDDSGVPAEQCDATHWACGGC